MIRIGLLGHEGSGTNLFKLFWAVAQWLAAQEATKIVAIASLRGSVSEEFFFMRFTVKNIVASGTELTT